MTKDIFNRKLNLEIDECTTYLIEYSYNFFYFGRPKLRVVKTIDNHKAAIDTKATRDY